jgi:Ran GTPase-activating protein (RanGAP) involved in mRNA processing and transport
MDALESNQTVKHFLLGNNVIGPRGAERISRFMHQYPDRIETWYLGGNCINAEAFSNLVDGWVQSNTVHSVWLKRNPLTAKAAPDVFRLVSQCKNLRTLDLDQTELSNEGTTWLFNSLVKFLSDETNSTPSLENIYLNGDGLSTTACKAINAYLLHPRCKLVSLFISNNPIGDDGLVALTNRLRSNKTLQRLTLKSCGLKDVRLAEFLNEVQHHPSLQSLDLSQSYITPDTGTRFNHFTDAIVPALISLIECSSSLKVLTLHQTYITHQKITNIILPAASKSNLLYFICNSVLVWSGGSALKERSREAKQELHRSLEERLRAVYGNDVTLDSFERSDLRWWRNTRDARFTDSVYRNRDAGLALRGQLVIKKFWDTTQWDEMKKTIQA